MPTPADTHCVLVPSYNHGRSLPGVLRGLETLGLRVIVVDDGSTDGTGRVLEAFRRERPDTRLTVLRHDRNRGKAAALRTGFGEALRLGHTHAVSIDADGQLDPADIPALVGASVERPGALVLGCRPRESEGRPRHCELGRLSAGFAVRAQTGVWLGDTQCGLRCYPIEGVLGLDCQAERFAYESEVITRTIWAGGEVIEVPVSCSYRPEGGRVSHYRPVVDSVRQGAMHVWLFGLAMLPLGRRGLAGPAGPSAGVPGRLRRFLGWMNPARCWRDLRDSDLGSVELGLAVACGAFIGATPFFGLHSAGCLYVAWRTGLHPAPMLLGSQVSIPPLGVLLGGVSILVGREVLSLVSPGERWASWAPLTWESLPALTWEVVLAWLVGCVPVGLGLAVGLFAGAQVALPALRRRGGAQPEASPAPE
ncbi:MAG: DUF2062 domain-containing protein [Phycisphaerales bacterium JB040]